MKIRGGGRGERREVLRELGKERRGARERKEGRGRKERRKRKENGKGDRALSPSLEAELGSEKRARNVKRD